jgi:nucleotide-binding universal stress UspA family protein
VRTVETEEGTVSVAPEIQEGQEPVGPEQVGFSRILIATDGSACSALAGRHAIYLAERLGAELFVLYAVNLARAFHAGIHYGEAVAELERFGKEATARISEMAEKRGVRCEERVVSGRPHDAIMAVSEEIEADLVVVGSTGMTSVERVLIGSESEKVLHYCKRPVLLIRDS